LGAGDEVCFAGLLFDEVERAGFPWLEGAAVSPEPQVREDE